VFADVFEAARAASRGKIFRPVKGTRPRLPAKQKGRMNHPAFSISGEAFRAYAAA